MEAGKATERCGAKTRSGGMCGKTAGWGTDHVGIGRCKLHLGATQIHSRGAAREQAMRFARGKLGQELDIDPLDGVLLAVRLAYGIVDFWRHRLAEPDVDQTDLHEQYSRALMDYTRICDIAVKAGVSERQIRIVERLGEQLSLVFEETLAAVQLDPATRRALVEAYARALAKHESIDSTATELAA